MITNYLYKNMRWQFNQNVFANLLAQATTEGQLYNQLEKIANSYFPQTRRIDTLETEFCLNKIGLSRAKTPQETVALNCFQTYWAQFTRLKNLFGKKYAIFPSQAGITRLEQVAELIAKCTQFAVDDDNMAEIRVRASEIAELTEREDRYLNDVIELYKIKYYCGSTLSLLSKKDYYERQLGRMLQPTLLKQDFIENVCYAQAPYCSKKLASVVDCMGNSAVRFDERNTQIETKLFVYANGRNVFDTFCKSRFGNRVAEFESVTKTVSVSMRYYVDGQSEVRNVTLVNNGAKTRKFSVQIPFRHYGTTAKATYFNMGNAMCIAGDVYSALAVVIDNTAIECYGEQAMCFDLTINAGSKACFDVVTVYANDTPTLADRLYELELFGTTRCPYLYDEACLRLNVSGDRLQLTPHGYVLQKPQQTPSNQLNFSYQLGDNDVATFVDNGGNCTTLIGGFVFGVRGEGVYSINRGLIIKLNEDTFQLDADTLKYSKKQSICCVRHDAGKLYEITHTTPCKTLFYFPLERQSQVSWDKTNNAFTVQDDIRKYTVQCIGNVESYTTSAIECNVEKLRYKLSGNIESGNCLAICFATAYNVGIKLTSQKTTPVSTPIIRESLVSTYLNYVNDKNVFCLCNRLKRPDALTVAAICYTNPQFVKMYLETHYPCIETTFYDATGRENGFCDRLAYPLAVVYYLNLVGELPDKCKKAANEALFEREYSGKDLCVKALALLRAARMNGFDKVQCLLEYNKIKKIVAQDNKLYAYAQAIGALPLTNPSKERLKDLCNKYDIPKSWYYVSQLENLYGLSISAGKLRIAPTVTAENVLEQFAINICGKRIDTTFAKATVQSMTLNGIQCFQPFYAQTLKSDDNQLVVRY